MYWLIVLAVFVCIMVMFCRDYNDAQKRKEKDQQLKLEEDSLIPTEPYESIYYRTYQVAQNKARFEEIRSMLNDLVAFYKKDYRIYHGKAMRESKVFCKYQDLIKNISVGQLFQSNLKVVDLHWQGKTYEFSTHSEDILYGGREGERIAREYEVVEISTDDDFVCQCLWGGTKKVSSGFIESGCPPHTNYDQDNLSHTELLSRSYAVLKATLLLISAEFDKQKAEESIARQKEALGISERTIE